MKTQRESAPAATGALETQNPPAPFESIRPASTRVVALGTMVNFDDETGKGGRP